MSAFYSIKFDDCIQVLSDGAGYGDDGILRHVGRKVFTSDALPIAISTRGHAEGGRLIADGILRLAEAASSVDAALEALPGFVEGMRQAAGEAMTAGDTVEVLIACWSETRGPRHFVFRTDETFGNAAYRITEMQQAISGGPQIDNAALLAWLEPHGLTPANAMQKFDGKPSNLFPRYGAEVAEYWRRQVVTTPGDSRPRFLIGGHVDLTTITAEGCKTVTLRTWPDKIGEPINPYESANVTPIGAGSRRNRRTAAKAQRRRRA